MEPRATREPSAVVRTSSLLLSRGLLAVCFGAIALFLPLIRQDLALSFSQAGGLSAASTFTYAVMQIPAGYLSDRFGPRRILLLGFLGTSALTLAFACVQTYVQALALQSVFGVFRALVFAPGLILIAHWFPPDRRSTALGTSSAANFVFTGALNLAGPSLAEATDWRVVLAGSAIAGLLAAGLFARLADDVPTDGVRPRMVDEMLWLLRQPAMRWISVVQFVRLGIVASLGFWTTTFLVEDRGISLPLAGVVIAVGAAVTAGSNLLGGYLSDRFEKPLWIIGGALVSLAGITAVLGLSERTEVAIGAYWASAAVVQIYFGPLFALPVGFLGARAAGLATGLGNFFANLGAFGLTLVFGVVRDIGDSFAGGFFLLSASAIVGVGASMRLAYLPHTPVAAHPGGETPRG